MIDRVPDNWLKKLRWFLGLLKLLEARAKLPSRSDGR